jgi:hypothetical protein
VAIRQASLNISGCIVRLDTDPHAAGTYRVTVNNILDRADPPNIISPNSGMNYDFTPPDVMPPILLTAELHGSDVVELVFDEPLDRTSSEDVSHYQILPSIQITEASLVGDSLNKVFLSTGAHQPGQSYTVTVQGVMDRSIVPNTIVTGSQKTYEYPAMDNTAPRLIAVTLEGDRFLEASFSEPLDKSTAEIPSNYMISPSIPVNEAILDASLQKVFIKTGIHQAGTVYTLTVQGVRDRANPPNTIGAENQQQYTCVSQDQVAPLLQRAEILASQIVELSFSEPVEALSALKIDNYTINNGISVLGATLSQSQMEVFLETTTHQRGTYTVSVSNVKDMAAIPNTILPNSIKSYTFVPMDTVAPILLSVVLMNPTMVEITFNEPLNRSSVENTAHYSINNAITVERAILDVTMTKIILQTSEHAPGSYSILLNGIQDASAGANTIAANTVSDYTYITVDNTPPYLVSSVLKSQSLLTVTFSEKLNPVSAENAANYAINNNITISNVVLVSAGDQVILETSNHPAGDYVLTVNGIYDASASQNKIAPYSQIQYSWIPEDITGPALVQTHTLRLFSVNL